MKEKDFMDEPGMFNLEEWMGMYHKAVEYCEELQAQYEELEEEMSEILNGNRGACFLCQPVGRKNKKMESALRVAREGLEFYGSPKTFRGGNTIRPIDLERTNFYNGAVGVFKVGGKTARETLQRIDEILNH